MFHGVPMYRRAPERLHVFVTVEPRDKSPIRIVLWRGWSVAEIRWAARKAYPDCDLQFGRPW